MRVIVRFRPSPAMVVAALALLVALAGTSAAAVALVPKNSVGSAQVIDGSLTSGDFAAGQILAGSEAFSRSIDGPVTPKVSDDFSTIATLSLPKPGAYVVWSHARVESVGLGGACRLLAGTARSDTRSATSSSSVKIFNAVVVAVADPSTVELQCGGNARGPSRVRDIKITAVRLAGSS